ncbi:facilitated trehalose transporter Tret1-like [Contarinia nasturtii]|uniref:facilitated trehalose transporter Tret1-like n=1 Tax=Contarinia nasturtii TaxID=265458 RepID=UPI0012D3B2A2|nr:facilitated trehalose transporter Tret1-like [Contarinia nasturtii]XP_031635119.1 facilitated trehalose transporter Tret1-like [Contarinia nasturtii]
MNESSDKVSRFRRILPQVIATTVKNFLMFDVGLNIGLPTVLVAALTHVSNEHNQNESLSITPALASWLGSVSYLFQPIGSMLSVFITDPLGRKRAMIIVNIPLAFGWFILYKANSVWAVFLGSIVLGLSVGLLESPIYVYLGEICQPSTRGVLFAYSRIYTTAGIFTIFLLNTLMPWRTVALICFALPIITAIALLFVPETPIWLISRNRQEDALKSLRWLRGWVPRHIVAQEFIEIQESSERSKWCNSCIKQNQKCQHPPPTFSERFIELKRKRTLKPFAIVGGLCFLSQFTSVLAMRPFIVPILKAYQTPIPADQVAAMMGFLDNIGAVMLFFLIHFMGKRKLYITSILGVFLCSLILCVYGYSYLPSGCISFDKTRTFEMENQTLTYIPVVCLTLWSFFSFLGIIVMPWMLLSEIFPLKSRGIASSISAALNYFLGFISKKTYYDLETSFSLPGMALFYCILSGCGLILMYLILPETENRSLEDIERHFSDNSKGLTDRNIVISKRKSKNEPNDDDAENSQKTNSSHMITNCSAVFENKNRSNESAYENRGFEIELSKL